ncbi:cytochrome c3 family protein [bacterium]|nr:cytochrome c3 family protein [bacterium]
MKPSLALKLAFHLSAFFLFSTVLGLALPDLPVYAEGSGDNDSCFACHSNPNLEMEFPSGEVISLYVNKDAYDQSVHGQQGFACTLCHAGTTGYPHEERGELNYRDYSISHYTFCTTCHTDQIKEINKNVHMMALAEGNPAVAVCTDCHGNHYIEIATEALSFISRTCSKCHSEINELYENSIHGAALIGEGNPDVPTCTDCHGAHEIIGPSNYPFHLFSPQICANCHADREMMARYGINPNVFDTYVADFHGKTVSLFQDLAPDQETNKPVCIDCHGVHDMLSPEDSNSQVMKANLLETCRKCHPEATTNFPDSWLGHYNPGPGQLRPVFYVKMIYWILIPILIGGSLVLAISDYVRQLINFKRGL